MQPASDALKQAAPWPSTGQRTRVVLASQVLPPGSTRRASDISRPARPAPPPTRSGWGPPERSSRVSTAAPAGDRQAGRGHWPRSRAAALLPGNPAGRLPVCAGRAETVAVGFEFVAAAKDQFPPGLLRAAYEGLSQAYGNPRPDEGSRGRPEPVRAADHRLQGDCPRRVPVRTPTPRRTRAGRARRPGD
jgi:hypothetical protein